MKLLIALIITIVFMVLWMQSAMKGSKIDDLEYLENEEEQNKAA